MLRNIVVRRALGALIVSGTVLAGACSRRDQAPAAEAASATAGLLQLSPAQRAKIHTVTVQPTTFHPIINTTGTVAFNGDRSTQVLAPVSGPVTQVFVEPGRAVSKGMPLAAVTSPDFAAAIAAYRKAQVTEQNLQRIAQQDAQLFQTDAIARRDVEQAQTDAAAASADRQSALQQLRSLGVDPEAIQKVRSNPTLQNVSAYIRAPISGTLVERLVSPGQLLTAGSTPTFTIADLSNVWVMANVFATDLGRVRAGDRVTITSDATPQPFTGTVDYVGATVDSGTRATTVRIVVQNRGALLKRAMFVNVSITSDRTEQGVIVPESAILRDDENLPYVYLSTQRGYARRRVTLGSHVGATYEIRSGLAPGDLVVGDGALFLQFAESQ